jgi:hypothetical protein
LPPLLVVAGLLGPQLIKKFMTKAIKVISVLFLIISLPLFIQSQTQAAG